MTATANTLLFLLMIFHASCGCHVDVPDPVIVSPLEKLDEKIEEKIQALPSSIPSTIPSTLPFHLPSPSPSPCDEELMGTRRVH